MKDGLNIDKWGNKSWYLNGKLHREDGPAVIYKSGIQKWYQHNFLHNLNGPAVIYTDGTQVWYINGQIIADTKKGFKDYLIQQNIKTLL